jgi:hypothetical protein
MKIKPKNISARIPIIMEFSDYHEINPTLDSLNEIFSKKLKAEELFHNGGGYYAIFFFKKDKEYKFLVKEHEATMDTEEEDE